MSLISGSSNAAGPQLAYTIDQSIRVNDDDSAYLYRTPASDGNRKTWTFSIWIKRGNIGTAQVLFGCFSTYQSYLRINADNTMQLYNERGSTSNWTTTQVFRDPGAWMHVVWQYDVTQAVANDRQRLWINGGEVTDFTRTSTAAQNTDGTINIAAEHRLFRQGATTNYYDGYAAEINFVDGTALDATSFGEYNDDGVWVPIEYTGTYGTNGFYITGETASDLGEDFSGNNNDFTSSGLATTDQMPDTPSNNFCTWNPIENSSKTSMSLQDGNLVANGFDSAQRGTIFVSSGKWYAELTISAAMSAYFGISEDTANMNGWPSLDNLDGYLYYSVNGQKIDQAGSGSSYGSSWNTAGKTVGVAVDMDNGAIWFSVDGTWQNSATITEIENGTTTNAAFTSISGNFALVYSSGTNGLGTLNTGQSSFSYTQPTGFNAWSTTNLPDPTIALPEKYFNTVLYEGNGGGQRVGQFQPITETYSVPNSVIFNDDDSAYLEKTYASSESTLTAWSFSAWVKRSKLGAEQFIFQAGTTSVNLEYLRFQSTDKIEYKLLLSSSVDANYVTSQVFKDTSSWMHIYAYRSSTTFKLYINGTEVTEFSTSNAPGSSDGVLGKNVRHRIGTDYATPANFLDGYLAEVNFIPGTAQAVSDFGQLDASTNKWIPKAYSGSYGTNGFYLDMETAPGTGSGAGTDSSGNGNNFTETGFAAADQVTDSPTESFATLNPLRKGSNVTLSDGNLVADCGSGSASTRAFSTVGMPNSGKWTFQIEAVSSTLAGTDSISSIGIISDPYTNNTDVTTGSKIGQTTNQENAGLDFYNGFTKKDNAGQITAAQLRNAGDKGIVAYDANTKELWLGYAQSTDSSWTWVGGGDPEAGTSPTYTMSEGNQYFAISTDRSKTIVRFGSNGDGIAPPTGFDYLNNDNLPLSNGDLSAFVWIKNRDAADNHMLFDAVRGVNEYLHISNTNETTDANTLTRFLKNGFEVSNNAEVNTSGESYVAWQWLNDGLTASTNTDGSITSSVLANTTSGFSLVSYTGNATAGATVGHGLGAVPQVVICKPRNASEGFVVQHASRGPTKATYLNLDTSEYTGTYFWNDTAPTSSVFTMSNHVLNNGSGNAAIAYCFAEVENFSKFGSFTGNGSSDGPFIYLPFRPAFFMMKRYDSTGAWLMFDDKRDGYNVDNDNLRANQTVAEQTDDFIDIVSNGVKIRSSATTWLNASGGGYLYMAFASSPFKTATAR